MTRVPGSSGATGGLRLYVAADDMKTVVARCAPMVAGPAEHRAVGPIVSVEPESARRPEYPGGQLQTLPALALTGTPRSGAAVIAAVGAGLGVVAAVALTIAATPMAGRAGRRGRRVAWRQGGLASPAADGGGLGRSPCADPA